MLKLSIKYLLSKKTQTFFTLFGIVLGSFAYVTINGFYQGFQGFLMENLVNNNPHIKITPRDSTPTKEALQSRFYKDGPRANFINHPKQQKGRDFIQSPELWYRRFKFDKDVVAFSPQISSNVRVTQKPRGKINSIGVRLIDFNAAPLKVSHWKGISDERIESWDQIHKNFLNVFKIQNVTRYLMVLITVIIASFGIFNVLNMMVNNKKRDIAIFGALGFTPKQISRIFLNQGIILGLIGGIFGLILGYFGCLFMETIPMGETPMGAGSGHLNVSFEISIYIKGFLVVFFSSVISSYFPSRVAFKLQPIDIIRGKTTDA
jgi:ABC-type lipoprotein release transport system permease subunit